MFDLTLPVRALRRGMLAAAALVMLAAPSTAADLAPPPEAAPVEDTTDWEVAIAAYVWGASLTGSVGVAGLGPVDVDASFGDVLSNLDFALMTSVEVRYDRFGVFGDLIYTSLSADGSGPLGLIDAKARNELFVGTLMGEMRVLEQGRSSLDLMAGARLWSVSADLELSGPFATRSASGSETWVDPMIGAKGRVQGASPLFATGWAMAGGFGVASDFGWDLFGGIGYEVTDRISIIGGYRGLGVDYEDDGFSARDARLRIKRRTVTVGLRLRHSRQRD